MRLLLANFFYGCAIVAAYPSRFLIALADWIDPKPTPWARPPDKQDFGPGNWPWAMWQEGRRAVRLVFRSHGLYVDTYDKDRATEEYRWDRWQADTVETFSDRMRLWYWLQEQRDQPKVDFLPRI